MNNIFSKVKRVFQSIDFRWNQIINVKTPTPTEDDAPETVVNKEYVDNKMIFKSTLNPDSEYNSIDTSIGKVVDKMLHGDQGSSLFRKPVVSDYNWMITSDIIDDKQIIYGSKETTIRVKVTVTLNDYLKTEPGSIYIIDGESVNQYPVLVGTDMYEIPIVWKENLRIEFRQTFNQTKEKVNNKGQLVTSNEEVSIAKDLSSSFYESYTNIPFIYTRLVTDTDAVEVKLLTEYQESNSVLYRENSNAIIDLMIPESIYSKYDLMCRIRNSSTNAPVTIEEYLILDNLLFNVEPTVFNGSNYKYLRLRFGSHIQTPLVTFKPINKR